MATILEHPEAQALLGSATITPEEVNACSRRLRAFLPRYLSLFVRSEQRDNATLILEGKLSGLDRKTSEPIANQAGVPRKPLQAFVGSGAWDDEAVMAEIRSLGYTDGWGTAEITGGGPDRMKEIVEKMDRIYAA